MSGELRPAARTRARLGHEHRGQSIEELAHARRQQLRESLERIGQVALEGCAGDGFEDVAAQIQGAQLGQREAGVDPFEHLSVETPTDVPIVIALIVERETRLLKGGEIAADRPGGDFEFLGQRIDRRAVPRRFERMQQLPLTDDFLVAGHGGILADFCAPSLKRRISLRRRRSGVPAAWAAARYTRSTRLASISSGVGLGVTSS